MRNFNKVAICGSHSCGKTTLVNVLKQSPLFTYHPLIKEIAAKYNPQSRLNMQTQFDIMHHQIVAEVTCVKNFGKFLSDRSAVDNLAYSTLVNRSYKRNEEVYKKCFALSYSHLHNILMPYDLLIFVDEILPYKEASHRNFSDFKSQEFIYNFIKEELTKLDLPYIMVSGSTNERVEQIYTYMKNEDNHAKI